MRTKNKLAFVGNEEFKEPCHGLLLGLVYISDGHVGKLSFLLRANQPIFMGVTRMILATAVASFLSLLFQDQSYLSARSTGPQISIVMKLELRTTPSVLVVLNR